MPSKTENKTDVLIIGAGPTGLMAGLSLAQLGVKARIIDKRGTRALMGRADGMSNRTMEILDSFDEAYKVVHNGFAINEQFAWVADTDGKLHRVNRDPAWGVGTSWLRPTTQAQGHTEALLMDAIQRRQPDLEVERGIAPISLAIDESAADDRDSYAITVELKHLEEADVEKWFVNAHSLRGDDSTQDEEGLVASEIVASGNQQIQHQKSHREGEIEKLQAKYVIGAEGAHSWVRHQLGFKMEGASTDSVWGVIDIVPITDFPDIRKQGTILGATATLINVPRENGLTRLYVQLPSNFTEASPSASSPHRHPTAEAMIDIARRNLHPYSLTYQYCDWYTVYRVGQRIATRFVDPTCRVFLGGDAVHTHTPKGGQGMNTSMQDAFNLGWKMAGVLNAQLQPSILATYESERRPVAQELVDIDLELSSQLSAAGPKSRERMAAVYARLRAFSDGSAITYPASPIVAVAPPTPTPTTANTNIPHHPAAPHLKLGGRFPIHPLTDQSTGIPHPSLRLLKTNGRFRLVLFAGDVSRPAQLARVNALGAALAAPNGLLTRHNPAPPQTPLIDVLLVYAAPTAQTEAADFDATFRPANLPHGGIDHHRIFGDGPPPVGDERMSVGAMHAALGIDVDLGALVVVRPDQYVAWVGALEDVEACAGWFAGFVV